MQCNNCSPERLWRPEIQKPVSHSGMIISIFLSLKMSKYMDTYENVTIWLTPTFLISSRIHLRFTWHAFKSARAGLFGAWNFKSLWTTVDECKWHWAGSNLHHSNKAPDISCIFMQKVCDLMNTHLASVIDYCNGLHFWE